ncbi:MAG: hypothetical protein ACI8UR_000506 [Natronomonas sp.]|jgi:hypothetical protein|uniref:DUF4440 domain-containing protein n=1 Tax=Natronomonas sp. TaxID=2184060 RepID=UPI003988B916
MLTRTTCEREITGLHSFFADWHRGEADSDDLGRITQALAPEFEMVTPAGNILDRGMVLDGLRETHGTTDEEFDIDIRDVEVLAQFDDHALVRYEEWQTGDEGAEGRISTVLFRSDGQAPEGVVWVALQETALS